MNLDANVQKIISLIFIRWKLIVLFAIIGALLSCFYTANFTALTYSSSVEFFAYAEDSKQEFSDSTSTAQQISNTSKMNYAIKMLDTYIELFKTNEFNQAVADDLNKKYSTSYSASQVKNSISIQPVEYENHGGYMCESFEGFSGYSGVIVECSRKSKKAEREALEIFMREHKEIVKRHFVEGDIDFDNPMGK